MKDPDADIVATQVRNLHSLAYLAAICSRRANAQIRPVAASAYHQVEFDWLHEQCATPEDEARAGARRHRDRAGGAASALARLA